jgi:GT2 family glycosyltransferase
MKVYIIIVTYNAENWIVKCLDSVYNRKYQIIVIDNASIDNTLEIIEQKYPNVQLIKSERNLGFGQANNIGLKIALNENTDAVLLLNQDAWVEQDTIDKLIKTQQNFNDFWILTPVQRQSKLNCIESNFNKYLLENKILIDDKIKVEGVKEMKFANAAIWLISRYCIETVGGFDPLFPHYGEDNDYVRRMHFWGGKLGVVPNAIGYHDREVNTNMNSKYEKKRLELVFIGILSDINHHLSYNIVNVFVLLARKYLKYFLSGQFKTAYIYNRAFNESISKLPQIKDSRKFNKQKGANLI